MRNVFAVFACAAALSAVAPSAYGQQTGLATAIYSSYQCNMALPLTQQSLSSKNRVGSVLAGIVKSSPNSPATMLNLGPANYCVDNSKPLLDQVPAANFAYRSDAEAEITASLSVSTFNLTGAEIKYVNEIIVSVQNASITDAPDNVLGSATSFSKTDPFCKTHTYTAVVVSNCIGSVDLRFYFVSSVTLGQIKAVIGKFQVGLGISLKYEIGQDNTAVGSGAVTGAGGGAAPPTECTPTPDGLGTTGRCYVRFYSTPAQPAVAASGSTPATPAVPAQTVVFGLVLGNPANF
jgi:hypothetical protein